MKTYYPITLCLLLVGTACTSVQEESVNTERPKVDSEDVFYATLEQGGASDATKVYADENLQVLWNADDRISIFNRYTYGDEYAFQGATGKTAGTFAMVADEAEFITGNPLDKIFAVYPYSQDNDINNTGELSIRWPSIQTYKPDSFGIGANVMVSVTTNNHLRFRNVGGYLAFKLYGDNVSVTSITLRGNNGEKLSGKASISCATDEDPTLSFDVSAQGSLRLNCAQPVAIGTTAEDATVFWFVVPPTQFTQGFNITVRTSDGGIFFKSTDASYIIERNTLCRMAAVEVVPSDIIPFEDANFKAYCVEHFDTNNDGEISATEALAVTTINVNTNIIESLQGVEYFENLTNLSCSGTYNSDSGTWNGRLTSLDVSNNTALRYLSCHSNQLSSLDVSNNTALYDLECRSNQLSSLDVSNNTALTYLWCSSNQLSSLDVSNNTALTDLYCVDNQLSSLDVSNNTALTSLSCSSNQLSSLDVSNNTALTYLWCSSNQLSSLDVSNNTALYDLECRSNQLSSLDVSNNTALTSLSCSSNQLSSLDVSNNTALSDLECSNNQLTSLDVSKNAALKWLCCSWNYITSLDVSKNTSLVLLYGDCNQLTSLDVSNNLDLTTLACTGNQLTSLDVSNNTALTSLSCYVNQLSSLDVSKNTALTDLSCYGNQLTSLDVSNNTALTYLYCDVNQLSSLDVSKNTALTSLSCYNNQLSSLDVSKNTALTSLSCYNNQLSSLDVSNNLLLTELICYQNPYLIKIWLKSGQTIENFSYDSSVAQVYYND